MLNSIIKKILFDNQNNNYKNYFLINYFLIIIFLIIIFLLIIFFIDFY